VVARMRQLLEGYEISRTIADLDEVVMRRL
jgi:hypothetical protein